jgi:5-enolpyruvylshikimate-3-phosphate synthase
MSARGLLAELNAAGIRVSRDGDKLKVKARPGVSIDNWIACIRDHRLGLLAEIVKAEVVAAASVEPARFDRSRFDTLMQRWHALDAHEDSKP